MLRWKLPQRVMFADKLPDTANLALGALFFGQFLGEGFSVPMALAGIALWMLLMAMAASIAGDLT